MGARLLGVIQVDVTEQAGAIARRPALVLRQRLWSEKADEQGERGDVGVGRGEQHGELSAERGPLVLLFGAPCHQYGHARRRVKRSHGHGCALHTTVLNAVGSSTRAAGEPTLKI